MKTNTAITDLATKASKTAGLLLQDMQEINKADAFWSLVILPEIGKLRELVYKLDQISAISKGE